VINAAHQEYGGKVGQREDGQEDKAVRGCFDWAGMKAGV
jgi:hypothetical protein